MVSGRRRRGRTDDAGVAPTGAPLSDGPAPEPRHRALLRSPLIRQLLTFGTIGLISTAAYALLYVAGRSVVSAPIANAAALVVTAIGNTAANRRMTFGVAGRRSLFRDHLAGLIAFGVALLVTTGSIALLGRLASHPSRVLELGVLIGANGFATIARFLLLRTWIAPHDEVAGPLERTAA